MSDQAPEKQLPPVVEPRKLVTACAKFYRLVDPKDLPRISEFVLEIDQVIADLQFGRNEQGRPSLSGNIKATLRLECQRCLEPMTLNIDRDIRLAIVWDEAQAVALPKDMDPWIVGEDEENLAAILEEELLLELPVVARHETDCLDPDLLSTGDEVEAEGDTRNPFGVLAELKGKP